MILSIQTWATGRPAPLRTLRHFIEGVSRDNRAKFVRCRDIAEWSRHSIQQSEPVHVERDFSR
jgi:hypothetical protein